MGYASFASVHRDRADMESGVLCQSYKEQALTENYDAGPGASIAKAGATRFVQGHPEHRRLFDTTVTYWATRLLVVASMPAALVSASVVASIPAFAASVPSVKTLIASSGPSPAGQPRPPGWDEPRQSDRGELRHDGDVNRLVNSDPCHFLDRPVQLSGDLAPRVRRHRRPHRHCRQPQLS